MSLCGELRICKGTDVKTAEVPMQRILYATILIIITALPIAADQTGSIFSREIRQEAQEALSYYGFDAGPADGIFGSKTIAAIGAYQTSIGSQPTGSFSRAGIGNLLQQYRDDRRQAGRTETPGPVTAAIMDMATSCDTTAEILKMRPGFLQEANLNNDGIADYLLDGSAAECSMLCGAANCQVSVIVSTSQGYRQNDFLGGGITPQTFNCLSNGLCEFAR